MTEETETSGENSSTASQDSNLHRVGDFIREQRRLVRLSQRELARTVGLSDSYLSQLERGLHEPSIRALKAIARGLNLDADKLISMTADLDDETPETDTSVELSTEDVIRRDARLTSNQKEALLSVLDSYVAANG